jgi:hypothetical protein
MIITTTTLTGLTFYQLDQENKEEMNGRQGQSPRTKVLKTLLLVVALSVIVLYVLFISCMVVPRVPVLVKIGWVSRWTTVSHMLFHKFKFVVLTMVLLFVFVYCITRRRPLFR